MIKDENVLSGDWKSKNMFEIRAWILKKMITIQTDVCDAGQNWSG